MMDLYFDKENIISFLSQRDKDDYVDCSRLVRRQLHVIFGFEKEEIGEWDENLRLCFLNEIDVGRGWKEERDEYLCDYLDRIDRDKTFAFFLLNNDHNEAITKKNLITGRIGEEIPTIKKLFCGSDYDLHKLYDIQSKSSFPAWEQLSIDGNSLPCTDMIIVDKYIYGNQYELVKLNLHSIIKELTKNNESICNIVIITIGESNENWEKRLDHIRADNHVNVTIVYVPMNKNGKGTIVPLPHDRTILTNYRLFRSGDSFCYFDSKGDTITNGKSLDVDSMAKHDTQLFADSFIKDIQKVCDEVHKKEYGLLKYFKGEEVSNLIKLKHE